MSAPAAPTASAADADERRRHVATLLERCAKRDERALEELYRLTSARLFGVALRLLRQEPLAEEVLQEAFLKIWRNAARYSSELGAPLTWLTSIVRNEALDTLRRRRVREDHETPEPARFADLIPDPAAAVELGLDDARLLLDCLERLEPLARDCIVRAYCEGYSHDELSAAHDRPLGTVKSWIRRGLVSLRSCLDERT